MKYRMQGFTLIELMIVIVVLAIITSIAVPTYRGYMLRAYRSDATAALLRVRVAQEKFFLQNNTYTSEMGPAGLRLSATAGTSYTTENGRYTIDFSPTPTATSYTARAQAAGGQTKDSNCTTFTITDAGARGTSPGTLANCWK